MFQFGFQNFNFFKIVVGVKGRTVCQEDENKGFIEVRDHYADRSGTWWQFCEGNQPDTSHLAITSYLNTITVKQISDNSTRGVLLNASLSVIPGKLFRLYFIILLFCQLLFHSNVAIKIFKY